MSPLVASAAQAQDAASIRSGSAVCWKPPSRSTPSIRITRSVSTLMIAPIFCRTAIRSMISGSIAALRSSVTPSARTAVSSTCSVAPTLGYGSAILVPCSRAGRADVDAVVALLDDRAELPQDVEVVVDRPVADPAAAEVGDERLTEPVQQRAAEQDRDPAGARRGRRCRRRAPARRCWGRAAARRPRRRLLDLHAVQLQQAGDDRDVADLRDVAQDARLSPSRAATMALETKFLAPRTVMSPAAGVPPSTYSRSLMRTIVLPTGRSAPATTRSGPPRAQQPCRDLHRRRSEAYFFFFVPVGLLPSLACLAGGRPPDLARPCFDAVLLRRRGLLGPCRRPSALLRRSGCGGLLGSLVAAGQLPFAGRGGLGRRCGCPVAGAAVFWPAAGVSWPEPVALRRLAGFADGAGRGGWRQRARPVQPGQRLAVVPSHRKPPAVREASPSRVEPGHGRRRDSITAPVRGLRAVRALRPAVSNVPNPLSVTRSPATSAAVIASTTASTASRGCLLQPRAAMRSTSSDLPGMVVPVARPTHRRRARCPP